MDRAAPARRFLWTRWTRAIQLDNPDAVIESTHALQMNAGLPIDYDHATDFGARRPPGARRRMDSRASSPCRCALGAGRMDRACGGFDRRARVSLRVAGFPVRSGNR